MQIQADASALLFSNVEQFVFKPLAFAYGRFQPQVGSLKLSGALLHTRLQFLMRPKEIFLGSPPLDELAEFTANGRHHIQQRLVLPHPADRQ